MTNREQELALINAFVKSGKVQMLPYGGEDLVLPKLDPRSFDANRPLSEIRLSAMRNESRARPHSMTR